MNKSILFFLLFSLVFFGCGQKEYPDVTIIPRPFEYYATEGFAEIDKGSKIVYDAQDTAVRALADWLALALNSRSSIEIKAVPLSQVKSIGNDIVLMTNLNDSVYGEEGYQLSHNNKKTISIQANHARGIFYGIQSLLQLLPPDIPEAEKQPETLSFPAVRIYDKPRFAYRGMHLDVARHFFSLDFVKQYIDLLALYKFNYFHWHLTEDQGWRIEIKAFPKLTEVGSERKETLVGKGGNPERLYDGQAYGGFYTQEEVREVVAYAQSKYITIIPEIEMPGHAMAALAAYPQLGCTGGPYEVATRWGVFEDVYCTTDEVFQFQEQVLSEVIELFPGPYVHIGGDEVPKTRWKACPRCQKRMKTEGLKDEHELQSYFIRRISAFLASKGKELIGWDEILEGGLAKDATVMSWRGMSGGIEAARMGHDVIMTPGSHCYFDHYQHDPATEPLAIGGLTTLSKVYSFEPVPEELNQQEAKHILGAQGNVWTEYLPTPNHITYMILPRMAALAEVLWTPSEKKDWKGFYDRLPWHFQYYDSRGLNYSKAVDKPMVKKKSAADGSFWWFVHSEIPNAIIHYTVDGSLPDSASSVMPDSLLVEEGAELQVFVRREDLKPE
jgi:hexosaminidase